MPYMAEVSVRSNATNSQSPRGDRWIDLAPLRESTRTPECHFVYDCDRESQAVGLETVGRHGSFDRADTPDSQSVSDARG